MPMWHRIRTEGTVRIVCTLRVELANKSQKGMLILLPCRALSFAPRVRNVQWKRPSQLYKGEACALRNEVGLSSKQEIFLLSNQVAQSFCGMIGSKSLDSALLGQRRIVTMLNQSCSRRRTLGHLIG